MCKNGKFNGCVIGHRKFKITCDLLIDLNNLLYELIADRDIKHFIFGSNSKFDALCFMEILKFKYEVKDLYLENIRAENEFPDPITNFFLKQKYNKSEYPPELHNARVKYVARNKIMIDRCDILVTYYNENYVTERGGKGGTSIAVEYAKKKNKQIINLFRPILDKA